MEGFHDQEALDALSEQISDALRPLGVTVPPEAIQYGILQGQLTVVLQGLVRSEARDRAQEDMETKTEFNQMMAEQNRMMQAEKKEEMAHLSEDPDALVDWLFSDAEECSHEHVHEGLCLDCHQVIT